MIVKKVPGGNIDLKFIKSVSFMIKMLWCTGKILPLKGKTYFY